MPNNSSRNLHWQQFIHLACARFAASNTAIGIEVAPLLLPFSKTHPTWNDISNTLPLAASINAINDDEFRKAMAQIGAYLTWVERGVFSNSEDVNRAYIELVGPEGVKFSDQFRFGIYWQQAHTFYPKHRHDALELYHIISGTALWQRGDQDFKPQTPGASFEHLDRIDHALKTKDEDLLAIWAWRGDLSFDNYTMDA
ncbi:dimethylsulfonioproprionate lyase family protein [Oceanospirillaceae bacterium]|nr:dimethylsulfonioproprionate lyase family protein [Oceanospirillaceae bacterium]